MRRFVAIDWGTTNRRAYLIDGGQVVETWRDDRGILSVAQGGFAAEAAAIRVRHGGARLVIAGMAGSNRGWTDAGYVGCPASLAALAANVVHPQPDVAIVPGVSTRAGVRVDVMRGEEVQLLGAVASGLAPPEALLCQPGTHCKWAVMRGGAIDAFVTAMTGELFALLKTHALIGAAMATPVAAGPAFGEGVAASADGDLLARLFEVRPASLLGVRDDADAASYVSGLLIGSDCRARIGGGDTVHLLADGALRDLYASAIAIVGGTAVAVDSHAAFVAGIIRIEEMMA